MRFPSFLSYPIQHQIPWGPHVRAPPSAARSPTLRSPRACPPRPAQSHPSQATRFNLPLFLSQAIRNKEPSCPVQMSEHILAGHRLPLKSHSRHHGTQGSIPRLYPALHPLRPHTSPLRILGPRPTFEPALQILLLLHVRTPGPSHLLLGSSRAFPAQPTLNTMPPACANSNVYFYFLNVFIGRIPAVRREGSWRQAWAFPSPSQAWGRAGAPPRLVEGVKRELTKAPDP